MESEVKVGPRPTVDNFLAEYTEQGPTWEMMEQILDTHKGLYLDGSSFNADLDRDEELELGPGHQQEDCDASSKHRSSTPDPAEALSIVPPGLHLFPAGPFRYFDHWDLSLQADFGYSRLLPDRANEAVREGGVAFLALLAPEVGSRLVEDETDFRRICDFLFYKATTSRPPDRGQRDRGGRNPAPDLSFQVCKKALFDMLKNYSYPSWSLGPDKVQAVLLNLGFNESVLLDNRHLAAAFHHRLNRASFGGNVDGGAVVGIPDFLSIRRSNVAKVHSDHQEPAEEKIRSFCLKNLAVLTSELLIAFGAPSEPIDTLWMFHAFATLASATNVAQEGSAALQAVTSIFDSLLESFTCDQWHYACSDSGGAHDGAACDVIEALWRVGLQQQIHPEIRAWTSDEASLRFDWYGHRWNCLLRLSLLPPTKRGTQVKKALAFMFLQQVIVKDMCELDPKAGIVDALEFLRKSLTADARLFRHQIFEDNRVMLYVVHLLDHLVGSEPDNLDCQCPQVSEAVATVSDLLAGYTESRDAVRKDGGDPGRNRVNEFIYQVRTKWDVKRNIGGTTSGALKDPERGLVS